MQLRWLPMDLHVHTVLSACAELEMLPGPIVERARALGLAGIGVTDHNSAENVLAVSEAGRRAGVAVFAGLELQAKEEVHILAFFPGAGQALRFQEEVYRQLPAGQNDPRRFGHQLVVSADGELLRENTRFLQAPLAWPLRECAEAIHAHGGLAIAAHIDRPAYGLLGVLGVLPPGLFLDAVELSRHADPAEWTAREPALRQFTLISSSDAHRLAEIAAQTWFRVAEPTFEELKLAFQGTAGREAHILAVERRHVQ